MIPGAERPRQGLRAKLAGIKARPARPRPSTGWSPRGIGRSLLAGARAVAAWVAGRVRRFGKWLYEGKPITLPAVRLGGLTAPAAGALRRLGGFGRRAGRFGARLTAPLAPVFRPVGRLLAPLFRFLAPVRAPVARFFRSLTRPAKSTWVRLGFSLQMAWHGVLAKPLRSALTILGVTIGVASIVSLMGVGEGARQAVMQQFESLGSNVVVVRAEDPTIKFQPDITEELLDRVDRLTMATPVVETKSAMRWRRTRGNIQILGVNEQFPLIRDHDLVSGHFFTKWHVEQRSPVAVLGYNVAASLMRGRSPVGQTFTMAGHTYRIVGVLASKGPSGGDGIDNKIIIPYTTALQIAKTRTVSQIWCKAKSGEDADLALVQLGRIFRRKLGIDQSAPTPVPIGGGSSGESGGKLVPPVEPPPPDGGDGGSSVLTTGKELVTITNLNRLVKEADKANQVMTLLLGGIAAVSLLVGGLGIMNIMLVAVTERTAEIGVRRALGAKQGDLLSQFLLEAFILSAVGAVAGVAMGLWGAGLFERWGLQTAISATAIEIAAGVALGTGLLFGVYPAWAASSILPAEALRR